MGELEKFVSRWSRRKRASDLKCGARESAESSAAVVANLDTGDEAAAKQDSAERTFDLSALPPLESITAATDIRSFLQLRVPVELTRAALRRAWVSDPLIRDFIGIAENQWDFTNPTTIPGFGPLPQALDEADRVARTVETLDRSLDRLFTTHPTDPTSTEAPTPPSDARLDTTEGTTSVVPTGDKEIPVSVPASSRSEETATHSLSRENVATERPRRAHGGAMPR